MGSTCPLSSWTWEAGTADIKLITNWSLLIDWVSEGDRCYPDAQFEMHLVFPSAKILTLKSIRSSEGKIAAVGYDDQVERDFGQTSFDRVVDASGCSIVPGLVDAHTHPVWAGDRVHEFSMKASPHFVSFSTNRIWVNLKKKRRTKRHRCSIPRHPSSWPSSMFASRSVVVIRQPFDLTVRSLFQSDDDSRRCGERCRIRSTLNNGCPFRKEPFSSGPISSQIADVLHLLFWLMPAHNFGDVRRIIRFRSCLVTVIVQRRSRCFFLFLPVSMTWNNWQGGALVCSIDNLFFDGRFRRWPRFSIDWCSMSLTLSDLLYLLQLAGATYMDIYQAGGGIHFTVQHTRAATENELYELLRHRLMSMLKNGTEDHLDGTIPVSSYSEPLAHSDRPCLKE